MTSGLSTIIQQCFFFGIYLFLDYFFWLLVLNISEILNEIIIYLCSLRAMNCDHGLVKTVYSVDRGHIFLPL